MQQAFRECIKYEWMKLCMNRIALSAVISQVFNCSTTRILYDKLFSTTLIFIGKMQSERTKAFIVFCKRQISTGEYEITKYAQQHF